MDDTFVCYGHYNPKDNRCDSSRCPFTIDCRAEKNLKFMKKDLEEFDCDCSEPEQERIC